MAKFTPFHVLTGSGTKEIGSLPYAAITIGYTWVEPRLIIGE